MKLASWLWGHDSRVHGTFFASMIFGVILMLSRLVFVCMHVTILSIGLGFGWSSASNATNYVEQEREHLQTAINNADHLDDYIPEEEVDGYLDFIEAIANCKSSALCENAGDAAFLLGLIKSHGTFGPPNMEEAFEYLKKAVHQFARYDAANYVGWLFLDHPSYKNEELAFSYLRLAWEKGDDRTAANATNLLGNFFLMFDGDVEKAAMFYTNSVAISEEAGIEGNFLAAENLSRILLYGNEVFARDLDRAAYFSEYAVKNGGHSLFKRIIEDFPIDSSTTHQSILIWLEELAASGETDALLELAYYAEFAGNKNEFLKWFNVCSIICERVQRTIANDKLSRYEQSLGTNDLNFARKQAGEWFTSRYRPIESPKTNGNAEEIGLIASGDFHVLLIGVNKYSHPSWPELTSPIADTKLLGDVLESKYGANLHHLKNPTKDELAGKLRGLVNTLSKDDSLMIYFGGHGQRSLDGRKGYWILTDGSEDRSTWFDHDELKSIVNRFDATNILIVSDSCFSGLLTANFKSSEIQTGEISLQLFNKYHRTKSIMTYSSGGLEEVPDTGAGDNSIFAHQLSRFFNKQEAPFTVSQLHGTVSRIVAGEVRAKLNIRQRPLLGNLPFHGHIGPDFVFIPLQE